MICNLRFTKTNPKTDQMLIFHQLALARIEGIKCFHIKDTCPPHMNLSKKRFTRFSSTELQLPDPRNSVLTSKFLNNQVGLKTRSWSSTYGLMLVPSPLPQTPDFWNSYKNCFLFFIIYCPEVCVYIFIFFSIFFYFLSGLKYIIFSW